MKQFCLENKVNWWKLHEWINQYLDYQWLYKKGKKNTAPKFLGWTKTIGGLPSIESGWHFKAEERIEWKPLQHTSPDSPQQT